MAAYDHPLWDALRRTAPNDAEAWRKWRSTVDLDRLDPIAYRLLPMLAKKITTLTAGDPQCTKLVGIVRRAWTENQLVTGKLQRVLALAGNQSASASGVSGCSLYFAQSGCVRCLQLLDVWVAPMAFMGLLAQLEAQGWQRQHFWPESAVELIDASGQVLTLRVKPNPLATPEELFIEAITGPEIRSELPWRYDAELLLLQASSIDWPQIRQRLRDLSFPPLAYQRLRQLRLVGASIPLSMVVRPGGLRAACHALADAYAQQSPHIGFIPFLARRWKVTPWRIPTEIIARTLGKAI